MAFSCYANFGEVDYNNNCALFPESPYFDSQEELLFYSDNFSTSSSLLPPPPHNLYAPEFFFPAREYHHVPYNYPNPKRQKAQDSLSFNEINMQYGFAPNPCNLLLEQEEIWPETLAPFPPDFASCSDFAVPLPVCNNSGKLSGRDQPVKKPINGGSLSAQSIAARQRRRKITEKTQQLGKLIPGGHKMNTAEMFQAAFKYVKFLKAQVGILQTMAASSQENGESFDNEELQPLVGSAFIQEKLYAADKCLVPKKFVQVLARDHELRSNSSRTFLDVNKLVN